MYDTLIKTHSISDAEDAVLIHLINQNPGTSLEMKTQVIQKTKNELLVALTTEKIATVTNPTTTDISALDSIITTKGN